MTYQRRYGGFRGVDFTNNPLNVDSSRSPYAENFITDGAGVVHKRPPYVMANIKYGRPHSTFIFKPPAGLSESSMLAVHSGKRVYFPALNTNSFEIFADSPSVMFQHNERLYLMDGSKFWVFYYDDSSDSNGNVFGWKWRTVREIATAPETQIAGYYKAEEYTDENDETQLSYEWVWGEEAERNLLTARRVNTFCGDGVHKVFYFDSPNFHVYKVEIYSPAAGSSAGSDGTVTIKTYSNIRKSASMSGVILANTGSSTPTCTTTGKVGKWYQIIYNDTTAYVHQDRVSAYSPPTPGQPATNEDDWTELTSGFTVSEVDSAGEDVPNTDGSHVRTCTKITFTTAPSVHPKGAGLPNIRITGAVTEIGEQSDTVTADNASNYKLYIDSDKLYISMVSIAKNGTPISSSNYSIADYGDHGKQITFSGETFAAGDVVVATYRRESFKDADLINGCNKYGKFGSYNTDRWFYTGNGGHLNRDWYSEPSDPTLVLENSYTDIGDSTTGIAGYLNYQADMLIIKYDSNTDCLFRRTANTSGDETIFPVRAYRGRGAVNAHAMANIKGECVFLTPEGVYEFISSDLGSRYSTKEMSYLIKDALLQEELEEAEMGVWGDWLMLSFPTTGHCYVADTTQLTAPSSSGGYGWEWYYWTDYPATNYVYDNETERLWWCTPTSDGENDKIMYTNRNMTDYQDYRNGTGELTPPTPYTVLWSTPQDALSDPARYKFIEARGTIMHFEPFRQTLQLAVVTDGNTVLSRKDNDVDTDIESSWVYDFEEIHASAEAPELIPYRRLHRFKYIQFIFRNDDPLTDGIALLWLEFQYRFGRYIH